MRRAAALFVLFALTAAVGAAEPSAKARAQQVLARRSYQTTLPDDEAHKRTLRFASLDPSFLRVLEGLAIAAALVGLGAVVFALVRQAGDAPAAQAARLAPAGTPVPPRAQDEAAARGPTLADADHLAEAGDYREAVHTLLLVAIDKSARLTSSAFPPSTTARELTRLLPLDEKRQEGFGALVNAVEQSLFAGRNVGTEQYAACRVHCLLVDGRRTA